MDIARWISFIEENKVGLNLELEGRKVLEVRPNGKSVDVEIYDIAGLKKLKGELKKWRG
jgi:hypothetical protein